MRRQAQIEEMERQREALKRAQAEEEERAREARKKAEREAAAAREAEARVGRTINVIVSLREPYIPTFLHCITFNTAELYVSYSPICHWCNGMVLI